MSVNSKRNRLSKWANLDIAEFDAIGVVLKAKAHCSCRNPRMPDSYAPFAARMGVVACGVGPAKTNRVVFNCEFEVFYSLFKEFTVFFVNYFDFGAIVALLCPFIEREKWARMAEKIAKKSFLSPHKRENSRLIARR